MRCHRTQRRIWPFVEAFIGTLKDGRLNHFLISTLRPLDYVVQSWVRHDNTRRPHCGVDIGNRVLNPAFTPTASGRVRCRRLLGGIIKEHYREAT